MADNRLPRFYHLVLTTFLVLMIGACGGGSGSDPGFIGGGVEDPGDTDPGDPDDPGSAPNVKIVAILTDINGTETNSITTVNPGTLSVTVTDKGDLPVPNVIVSATATIGELQPSSGTALTDLNGEAAFRLEAGTEIGAGTVTASIGNDSTSLNYQIGAANLRIGRFSGTTFIEGEIEAGATSLPAAGSTPLTVIIVDLNDLPVTSSVTVLFGSSCASLTPPTAEITEQVNTINGVAVSTYTATGCTGTDNATATIVQGNAKSATVVLDIASASANSISFLSADPALIALKGTGGEGRQESSTVEFQVLDTTGGPMQGINVEFSLSTEIGGLSLTNDAATTNSAGIATAIVLSGNISTSVRVTASIDVEGELRSTVSDKLVVSTGLPDQNSLSLTVTTINPGGGDLDGVTTTVNVRMADKFNNPVPDGTSVFFTTEYGAIDDSCQTTTGACSVTWHSQEPREPLIYNNFNGQDYMSTLFNRFCLSVNPPGGAKGVPCDTDGSIDGFFGSTAAGLGRILGRRSTVLASSIGEESFVDANGNGLYDTGEDHQDLGEAFLDNNENRPAGSWLSGFDGASLCTPTDADQTGRDCGSGLEETFVDFNVDGNYTPGNGIYNGSLCPQELANLPSPPCTRELVSVRDDLVIVMPDGGGQDLELLNSGGFVQGPIVLVGSAGFSVVVSDAFNNMPRAGSTVTVTSDVCELSGEASFVVPNTGSTGAFRAFFTLQEEPDNEETETGLVTIVVGNTGGNAPFPLQVSCTDPAF